ncbi:hypothetical protein [Streptomyces tendae]|uniref:hypothetical protein n=1 Tax=Streptomyces tendae TaxID=1932 RepID=UPI00368D6865
MKAVLKAPSELYPRVVAKVPTGSFDARGYEAQFATNHLSHFQLTLGLLPALRAAHGALVVHLSSGGHRLTGIRWDDVHPGIVPGTHLNSTVGENRLRATGLMGDNGHPVVDPERGDQERAAGRCPMSYRTPSTTSPHGGCGN